jgi:hypothetical protein
MLTRSGVAKRLGKSIATVRRMEGHELHPVKDENGVHRFDPEEVAEVARSRRSESVADDSEAQLEQVQQERVAEELDWLQWQRQQRAEWARREEERVREEVRRRAELQAELERRREEHARQELVTAQVELLETVESLTPRDWSRLDESEREELEALLDEIE